MEAGESSETMTVDAIEWPFLKSQRHDNSSPDDSADHYEIVVSNVDDGTDGLHHFSKFYCVQLELNHGVQALDLNQASE